MQSVHAKMLTYRGSHHVSFVSYSQALEFIATRQPTLLDKLFALGAGLRRLKSCKHHRHYPYSLYRPRQTQQQVAPVPQLEL